MMRTGFPGYGSALQAKVRSPARNAGATRSLAAERRFKRTDEASGGDLQSSIRPTLVLRYDDGRRQPSRRASRPLDQCGGLLHDRLGRAVSPCEKRVDLGRRERLDLQLRLVRIGAKFTIGYRGVEGAPQRGETIGRHAGRRGKRAPRLLPDQDQLQHLLVLHIDDEDKPQIPSASPRSTASVKPAPVSYPAITLNLVPTSAFNVLGTIAVFEVAPAAATMTSRARAAAMVLTSERCQVAQTFCNLPMLPSQPNFCAS